MMLCIYRDPRLSAIASWSSNCSALVHTEQSAQARDFQTFS